MTSYTCVQCSELVGDGTVMKTLNALCPECSYEYHCQLLVDVMHESQPVAKFKPENHIIGKVYDLTQENMNLLIAEFEHLTEELRKIKE